MLRRASPRQIRAWDRLSALGCEIVVEHQAVEYERSTPSFRMKWRTAVQSAPLLCHSSIHRGPWLQLASVQ